jgi:hypothetical protein
MAWQLPSGDGELDRFSSGKASGLAPICLSGRTPDRREVPANPGFVALSELRLNSALVSYLRRHEGVSTSADTVTASEATSQQYQPWSLDRRFSEADIQTIIAEFLSGTPKHELARRYSVSLSGIKNLLRRRGIRRDGRRDTHH